MDTVKKGRFKKNSIDHLFEKPKKYDFRIKTKSAKNWSVKIYKKITTIFKIDKIAQANCLSGYICDVQNSIKQKIKCTF